MTNKQEHETNLPPREPMPKRLMQVMAQHSIEMSAEKEDNSTDRLLRATRLAEIFADDHLPEPAYDVIRLIDRVELLRGEDVSQEQSQQAARELKRYIGNLPEEVQTYTTSLLSDMRTIDGAAKSYLRQFVEHLPANQLDDTERGVLASDEEFEHVPNHLWHVDEPEINTSALKRLAITTNAESVVIKAVEAVDNLQYRNYNNELEMLQAVLEAETFYAPLCEIWGFDAMAMTIRDAAARIRLEKQGLHHLIKRAERICQEASEFNGVDGALDHLFGENTWAEKFKVDPRVEQMNLAELIEAEVDMGDGFMRVIARLKTAGSLARKLNAGYETDGQVMDIIGLTAIVDDEKQLGHRFAQVLGAVAQQERSRVTRLEKAPSKDQPIYVVGNSEYVSAVKIALEDHPLRDRVQYKEADSNDAVYQVCKFTCKMANEQGFEVPVEMQFVTAKDRQEARIGQTAHILYKQMYKSDRNDTQLKRLKRFLRKIHARKQFMLKDNFKINERTRKSGLHLMGEIQLKAT